jgi:putative iron-dependent peroxidase
MLENMFIGRPPGNYDRILDFSRAVTGNLFFVPTAIFLEDVTSGVPAAAQPATPPPAADASSQPVPPMPDHSLGIGSLKGEPRR